MFFFNFGSDQVILTYGILVQMSYESTVWGFEHEGGVHVTFEDGVFQLEIRSKVLFTTFLLPQIKSSFASPFGVPQSPLNWFENVFSTYRAIHLDLTLFICALSYTSILILLRQPCDKVTIRSSDAMLIEFPVIVILNNVLSLLSNSA